MRFRHFSNLHPLVPIPLSACLLSCCLTLVPTASAGAQGLELEPELRQVRPAAVRRQPVGTEPAVSLEPLSCVPAEDNGVVVAKVRNDPKGARVHIYFRRVSRLQGDFYFVKAHMTEPGIHKALLPRPLSVPASSEPVELYAAVVNHLGQQLARSASATVAVTASCPRTAHPIPGEALNLTLGETTALQGEAPPFHFECTGIVTREFRGRLYQDSVCRDYFVPFEPRVKPVALRSKPMGSAMFHNVTVFYGTDRKRSGSEDPGEHYGGDRGDLELGTCEVTIPLGHRAGELEGPGIFERPDPEKHIVLLTVTPRSEDDFVTRLDARVGADSKHEILVFIHGYNVSFEDAARRTAQMAADLNFDGAPMMYSWPSQAALAGYPVDEANIRWTVPHLQQFLDLLTAQSGASKVHLVAHSMGSRALTETLLRYAMSGSENSPLFNQIVLVAPDVDADVFRDEIVPRIRPLGERITLYASTNDKALKISEGVHGYPRAGDLSSGIVISDGVETIDASYVDTSLLNAISLGHSYFADQPTVIDDLRLLLQGRNPFQRGLSRLDSAGQVYWAIVVK